MGEAAATHSEAPARADVDWEGAWQEGRTRWDAGASSPTLLALDSDGTIAGLLSSVQPEAPYRVLVPGAGSGYDVFTLARAGRDITGVDLAPSAEQKFSALRSEHLTSGSTNYLTRDFFSLPDDPAHRGRYHLIWDYTFFCALPPRLRDAWAATLERLLRPSGVLLTLMYPLVEGTEVDRDQGPPFPLSRAIYERHLLASNRSFQLERLAAVDRSHPGREGREGLAVWRRKA